MIAKLQAIAIESDMTAAALEAAQKRPVYQAWLCLFTAFKRRVNLLSGARCATTRTPQATLLRLTAVRH
jgi:hypothetical protein